MHQAHRSARYNRDSPEDEVPPPNTNTTNALPDKPPDRQIGNEIQNTQSEIQNVDVEVAGSGRRQELIDASEVGARLMTNLEQNAGILKAAVQTAIRASELVDRAHQVNLIDYPLNEWKGDSPLGSVPVRRIVNEIPHILNFRRIQTQMIDEEVTSLLGGQYGAQCDLILNSMRMFASNTDRVSYMISTAGTTLSFTYDPESPPASTLHLESFKVTGADSVLLENPESRTNAFSGLLELILKVMRQGDVYIQAPPMTAIGDFELVEGPLGLLRGRNIPNNMLPHITFSTYAHTLPWFKQEVTRIVPFEEVVLGEFDGVEKCAGSDAKKKSNYAVITDHIYATLHQIFMQEHDQKRADAFTFCQSVRALMFPGSTIQVIGDTEADMWETYQPDHEDSHRYVFLFLISTAIRNYQYNYLCELFKNMRGIRAITATDRLRTEQQPVDPFAQRSLIDEALIRRTRGYTIEHWYQMMVMELAHRFIEPLSAPDTMFTTIQDAIFSLLAVALDALCFPNLFWTNIHIYSYVVYRAWHFASPREYNRIIHQGYTEHIQRVKQLTKQEIRDGEIPRIFLPGANNLPPLINRYLQALEPIGQMHNLLVGQTPWSPNIDEVAQFYIPFSFERRPKIGSVVQTPFSDQFLDITTVLGELTQAWGRANGQSRNNTAPLLTTLNTLTVWSRTFGSIAHYELNVLYRAVSNGPEIISTSYRGGRIVNRANILGVGSTVELPGTGLPAIDRSHKLYFGIGLWGMMSLVGDRLSTAGTVETKIPTSFQFFDPQHRYIRFVNLLQQSKNFSEAFGLMTYFLDAHDNPNNPMQFLVNVFGQSLKAGTANQILNWLIQDVDIKTVIYGKLASRDSPLYVDQRLRAPRACEIGVVGQVLPARPDQSVYFQQPLDLLSAFTVRKLEVATTAIASDTSPIHRYCSELVVAKSLFDYYSPENRHPDPDILFEYDPLDDSSGFQLMGNETKAYFMINGRRWTSPIEPGFPTNVGVIISNPVEVIHYHWDLLEVALEYANWQIHFVRMNFLTRISTVTRDVAKALASKGVMDWQYLKTQALGTIVPVTFYDDRSDLINNRTTVFPAASTQYICAIDPVERNVAVRGIVGLQPPHSYRPPDREMWTIGMRRSNDIPMTENGIPKFQLPTANFNNFVQIYTSNAQLDGTPPLHFMPPRGEDV